MAGIDSIGGSIAVQAANASPPVPAAHAQAPVVQAGDAGATVQALAGASAADLRAQAAQVLQSANNVQQMLAKAAPNLTFSVDKDYGRVVIRIVDPETHEVLRQIPPEDILRMDKNLDQMIARLKGLLVDRQI